MGCLSWVWSRFYFSFHPHAIWHHTEHVGKISDYRPFTIRHFQGNQPILRMVLGHEEAQHWLQFWTCYSPKLPWLYWLPYNDQMTSNKIAYMILKNSHHIKYLFIPLAHSQCHDCWSPTHFVTRPSATILLTIQDKWVLHSMEKTLNNLHLLNVQIW